MNSVSGRRASDRSAPGTTTVGPTSPPMASSAILTFWAIAVGLSVRLCEVVRRLPTIAGRGHGYKGLTRGTYFLTVSFLAQPASAANGFAAASPGSGASNATPALRG